MGLSFVSIPSMAIVPTVVTVLVFMLSGACIADAYALSSSPSSLSSSRRFSHFRNRYSPAGGINNRREDGSAVTLYLFPTPPSILAANYPHKRQQQLSRGSSRSSDRPKTNLPMNNSVLAESDILPSFQTAHGLLSPEVVMRIADTNDLEEGGPLHKFLKTYKSSGPMACVSMLSDPCILPELTRAMRDIA